MKHRRPKRRRRLLEEQVGGCSWCGLRMGKYDDARIGPTHPWAITIEHLLPRGDPNRNERWAIVGAHGLCNRLRALLEWDDFIAYVRSPTFQQMFQANREWRKKLLHQLIRQALAEVAASKVCALEDTPPDKNG